MPSLFVIRGNDQGSRFVLEKPVYRLGRDSTSAIQVHDTEVSRHHAEIIQSDQDYVVSDQNSSNGTYVNGKPITRHRLSSGDQVQVGSTLMLYTGPAEDATEDIRTINIAPADKSDETHPSRIVTSMPQEEGSHAFDQDSVFVKSPWIARARPVRPRPSARR